MLRRFFEMAIIIVRKWRKSWLLTFSPFVSMFSKAFFLRTFVLTLHSTYTHFNTLKKKDFTKILWKKVKLLKMSNFTFYHNVFYSISILKSFNSQISIVVYIFFEFGTVSKRRIREWDNPLPQNTTFDALKTKDI